jgi:hypothetical protein
LSPNTIFVAILVAVSVGVVAVFIGILTNWLSETPPPAWLRPPRIVIAIGVAVVLGGAIPIIGQLATADPATAGDTSTPPSTPASPTAAPQPGPATPSATAASSCFSFSAAGGSSAAVLPNPQASTHDVTLQSASFFLDRRPSPPTITVAGQVAGRAPAGMHLWVVGNPDRRTRGEDGNPGSGRFYPSAEIRPDSSGCWRDTPLSIGYDEAIGITVTQLLVQVDDTASAEFGQRALHPDGLSEDDLGRLGVDTIAFFSVPTAP